MSNLPVISEEEATANLAAIAKYCKNFLPVRTFAVTFAVSRVIGFKLALFVVYFI